MSKWTITISFFGVGVTLERHTSSTKPPRQTRQYRRPYLFRNKFLKRVVK